MKTLDNINSTLKAFEDCFKINAVNAPQGSETWLKLKLGVLSASNASKIVAKKDSETRATYMAELVAQVCTGQMEELNNKYVDHGKAYEDAARSTYEFQSGINIEQVPFVFLNNEFREGCSPDGLATGSKKGIEIKVPYNPVHYVKFLVSDKAKKEYDYQVQYSMRILGCETYDFVQYCPTMRKNPIKVLEVERDEKTQALFADAVPQFLTEMDAMLEKIGIRFGDQWK
jgi:putative phage-type endonuclease